MGSTSFHRSSLVGRVSNYLSYLLFSLVYGLRLQTDVILVMTDPPLAVAVAVVVGRIKDIPVVYNVQDLHPEMAIESGMVSEGLLTSIWDAVHQWAMNCTAAVITIGEDMRELIIGKGVEADKVRVVRNGAVLLDDRPTSENPLADKLRAGFEFVAMHAGNIGYYGAWDTIIAAGRYLRNSGIGIVFVGDGVQKERLRRETSGLQAIEMFPFQPRQHVPMVLASADVHIVTIKPGVEGTVVPSKLFPILAAGRGVVALMNPGADAARIVERYGCGVVVDPESPRELADSLVELSESPELVERMCGNAQRTAELFQQETELQRFVAEVESCC